MNGLAGLARLKAVDFRLTKLGSGSSPDESNLPAKPTWVRRRSHKPDKTGSRPGGWHHQVPLGNLVKPLDLGSRDFAGSIPAGDTNCFLSLVGKMLVLYSNVVSSILTGSSNQCGFGIWVVPQPSKL